SFATHLSIFSAFSFHNLILSSILSHPSILALLFNQASILALLSCQHLNFLKVARGSKTSWRKNLNFVTDFIGPHGIRHGSFEPVPKGCGRPGADLRAKVEQFSSSFFHNPAHTYLSP